ncbi:hypothetical protein RIF29_41096 [Crotalaria pallida]|uniref:Uncharacterized protein n=1 Tax=Crotalaria pallida TaxID=3830 RepID=A0AAN9E9V0_CROPI
MHVTRSRSSNLVNPLIIGRCDQKEAISSISSSSSGSETGADSSSLGMVAACFTIPWSSLKGYNSSSRLYKRHQFRCFICCLAEKACNNMLILILLDLS